MDLNLNNDEIILLKKILADESAFSIGKTENETAYDGLVSKLGINESAIMQPDTRVNSVHRYMGDVNWDRKNIVSADNIIGSYNHPDNTLKTRSVLTFSDYERTTPKVTATPVDEEPIGIKDTKIKSDVFNKKDLLFDPNNNDYTLVKKFSEIKSDIK